MNKSNKKLSFEESLERLEEILENIGAEAKLEESLKLYEEADSLIKKAQTELSAVESKVEKLIKNQSQESSDRLQEEAFQVE